MTTGVRAYRALPAEGLTYIDVVLACYDHFAENLMKAGEHAARGDVALRCRHSERALLLLGHLESWVGTLDDHALQESLTIFYHYLRAQLLSLQTSNRAEDFASIAMNVCDTRAAWQKKQSDLLRSGDEPATPSRIPRGDRLVCFA